MADKETELEWAKSRRIEAERMKAIKAMETDKPDNSGLALLKIESADNRVVGFTRGKEANVNSIEKLSNTSVTVIIGGIAFDLLLWAIRGLMLNDAGNQMVYYLRLAGEIALGAASFIAVFSIIMSLWYHFRHQYELGTHFRTAMIALGLAIIYAVIRLTIMV